MYHKWYSKNLLLQEPTTNPNFLFDKFQKRWKYFPLTIKCAGSKEIYWQTNDKDSYLNGTNTLMTYCQNYLNDILLNNTCDYNYYL